LDSDYNDDNYDNGLDNHNGTWRKIAPDANFKTKQNFDFTRRPGPKILASAADMKVVITVQTATQLCALCHALSDIIR
jgi:hypothetical protein